MVIVREVGVRFGLVPDTGLLSLLTTLAATAGPLIGYWIIQKIASVSSCSSGPTGRGSMDPVARSALALHLPNKR